MRPWTATASVEHRAAVDIFVEGIVGGQMVDQLDRTDLNQLVALVRVEPVVSVSMTISRIFPLLNFAADFVDRRMR